MRRNEWVENADRLVAGFLERFEEGFHKMVGSLSVLLYDLRLYAQANLNIFREDIFHLPLLL